MEKCLFYNIETDRRGRRSLQAGIRPLAQFVYETNGLYRPVGEGLAPPENERHTPTLRQQTEKTIHTNRRGRRPRRPGNKRHTLTPPQQTEETAKPSLPPWGKVSP